MIKKLLKPIHLNLQYRKHYYMKKIIQMLYPSYSLEDLLNQMSRMGLKKSQTLFIHSSWDQFINFTGKPIQLINAILDILGPDGTLAMPAYPNWNLQLAENPVFDVKKTPSAAGLLTEFFRRHPNTKRSINLNHSVCAIGKHADFLIKDHHYSETSWDTNSPYYRLSEINGIIMGLGVGHDLKIATCLHCIDSLLKDEIPFFSNLFQESVTYTYIDQYNNQGKHTFIRRNPNSKINTKKISAYMDKTLLIEKKLSNLDLYSIPAKYLIDKSIQLAKKGITMYTLPKPKKSLFYPSK
ncbi:MAG: hypothetical protein CMP21_00875 [Rickettsiales bacterium]|nr:hypothetical protein [Rickettsiales bacterium]|tara:strand:- start:3560 stop:4447 length:888 start_codon:yes stop_codon:yes gene_type:complete